MSENHRSRILDLARRKGVVRAKDLCQLGVPRSYLSRMVAKGQLLRLGRGLYTLPDRQASEHGSLAEVAALVPHSVINLLSAMSFHDLTTEAPNKVWIAIARNAHRPRLHYPSLEITFTAPRFLELGVDAHDIEGVPVRITNPARTVADAFKFRGKVGLDVALDALRDYLRLHPSGRDELWNMARACRVWNILRPYLEALS